MPIYVYQCAACGRQFDRLFLSLSRIPAEITCPACQSMETRRLISAPAIHTGESGRGESPAAGDTPASTKPAVFGRKELNEATAKKKELRERAAYGE